MAGTDVSETPILTTTTGRIVSGSHYEAEQLANLTIIDYTKDLLSKNIRRGIHLTQAQVNRFFRRCVFVIFPSVDVRREIMLQQVTFPIVLA